MADSAFKTQVSADENANALTNPMFVQLSDGSAGLSVTGGVLDVNATVVIDSVFVDDSAFGIGTDKVNAQGFLADETATDSVDEGDIGIARMTLDRRMIVAADQNGTWTVDLGATDNAVLDAIAASLVDIELNTDFGLVIGGGAEATALRVTIANDSTGVLTVDAVNLDIRDIVHTQDSVALGDGTGVLVDVLDATVDALFVAITDGTETMAINADGSINVAVVPTAGTRVHDAKSATPGAGASDNHDYTVVGTTFELNTVTWGGSGKEKVEVLVGPVASLVSKYVGFSEKDTPGIVEFTPAIEVPATGTGTVRVTVTNRQGAAVDVYSTIMGTDIA